MFIKIMHFIINYIKSFNKKIETSIFKLKWRKYNKKNYTTVKSIFPINMVNVGDYTYGDLNIKFYEECPTMLQIGYFCSIAPGVKFLLGGEHNYKKFSTYPFSKFIMNYKPETLSKGDIIIGDDVWIGEDCLILSGVKIAQGAIVAAGSTVYKDIPPYAIYGNNKVIKYRFTEEIIKKLICIDFKVLDINKIKESYNIINLEVNENNIDEIFRNVN